MIGYRLHLCRSLWRGIGCFAVAVILSIGTWAQTDCSEGNSELKTDPPKGATVAELIGKITANETRVREARAHYTYTQDTMVQTLSGTSVDGQFHEVTTVSYDSKGKRMENVTFSEVPTLRGIQISAEDMQDIREFMPWLMTSDVAPAYNITYAGQQHVDDLDTYVFHVEPKTEEKNKRYFQGRVWVDSQDLVVVKLCGKSMPEIIPKKKKDPQDLRPTFVTWRQLVDGNWFPAYSRIDDTLHFRAESVHVREVVKFTGYRRGEGGKP